MCNYDVKLSVLVKLVANVYCSLEPGERSVESANPMRKTVKKT